MEPCLGVSWRRRRRGRRRRRAPVGGVQRHDLALGPERAPVGRRGGPDDAPEVAAQRRGRAEPALLGHPVDRQVARLEQALGVQHPLAQQPLHRRRAGGRPEPAGEAARAEHRPGRQVVDGHRLVEVGDDPVERPPDRVVGRQRRHRRVHELGLAAVALGRDDHAPGDLVRHLGPVVEPHDVEAQVDARSRARRRVDAVAGVDAQHVAVDLDLGVAGREVVGVHPVRGRPPAVEQPGLGQQEGARAHADEAATAGVDGAQGVEQLGRRRVPASRATPAGSPCRRRRGRRGCTASRRTSRRRSPGTVVSMAPMTRNRYHGLAYSERSSPKTSWAVPSSKAAACEPRMAATRWPSRRGGGSVRVGDLRDEGAAGVMPLVWQDSCEHAHHCHSPTRPIGSTIDPCSASNAPDTAAKSCSVSVTSSASTPPPTAA